MKTYKVISNPTTKKFDVVDENGTIVQSGLEQAAADSAAAGLNAGEKRSAAGGQR
jgi:hypothetical protein